MPGRFMLGSRVTEPIHPAARQPIFNIPPITGALLIANVAVHGLRLLLTPSLDDTLVETFAFIPARYTEPGGFGWPALVDPVTYQFLHGSLTHLAINMLALLAFGAGVERRIGGGRMLTFALFCGVASAAAHLVAYPASVEPVIGASGAISGLFGGVLRFRMGGGSRHGLWPLVALWIAMDVITGVTGLGGDGESIAWVAHIGGFLAGLLLFGWFDRGRFDRGRFDRSGEPPL
jgi:membrane associated rhomboid family serine protease